MWCDWNRKGLDLTFDDENNMTIDGFQTIDSERQGHVIADNDNSKKACLFAKVFQEHALLTLGGRGRVE